MNNSESVYIIIITNGDRIVNHKTFIAPGLAISEADSICKSFESDCIYPLTKAAYEPDEGIGPAEILFSAAYTDGVSKTLTKVVVFQSEVLKV